MVCLFQVQRPTKFQRVKMMMKKQWKKKNKMMYVIQSTFVIVIAGGNLVGEGVVRGHGIPHQGAKQNNLMLDSAKKPFITVYGR